MGVISPTEGGTEFVQLHQQSNAGRFQEQMAGIFNPAGWGAYFVDELLFIKQASVIRGATYPDFGCNFEVFTNPEFLELETLGARVRLASGETSIHTERWTLFRGVGAGEGEEWIRRVVAPRAVNGDAVRADR